MIGISSKALQWFSAYLSDRFQSVGVKGRVSSQENIHYGVHQGSGLRPVLFIMCIQPLSEIISHSSCGHQKFADCTQRHLLRFYLTLIHWLLTLSSVLTLWADRRLETGWSWAMITLKLFWLDLVEGSACYKITTWELAIMTLPLKIRRGGGGGYKGGKN